MRFPQPVLDLEYLRQFIPAAFAEKPRSTVSSSFAHINTATVIAKMFENGFVISRAQQKRTRTAERREFTRHLVAFRRVEQAKVDDFIPEFVLVNAHDGTTAYNLYFGIYKVLCANGLVVGSTWGGISVHHRGDVAQAVLNETFKLVEAQGKLFEKIDVMKQREMGEAEQHKFAIRAMDIRYGDQHPFAFQKLLEVRRQDDAARNLWTVLNRIQENLMKGGQQGQATTGRRITIRPIERVTKDVMYNRKLWDLAETYL